MPLCRLLALWTLLALLLVPAFAFAQDLALDGSVAAEAVCPDGGTSVNSLCQTGGTAASRRGCMYGGEHEFDSISLTNGAVICVTPFDGVNRDTTGNLVLKSLSTDRKSVV